MRVRPGYTILVILSDLAMWTYEHWGWEWGYQGYEWCWMKINTKYPDVS